MLIHMRHALLVLLKQIEVEGPCTRYAYWYSLFSNCQRTRVSTATADARETVFVPMELLGPAVPAFEALHSLCVDVMGWKKWWRMLCHTIPIGAGLRRNVIKIRRGQGGNNMFPEDNSFSWTAVLYSTTYTVRYCIMIALAKSLIA